MEAKERREKLVAILKHAGEPVIGAALAKELGVSRQVIVGDIAILRAAGAQVYATPQGYIVISAAPASMVVTGQFACRHGREQMADELAVIIENGGRVLDVIVEHPMYGEIKANLMLSSRRSLDEFLHKSAVSGAEPLSLVTGGVHLHTVEAASTEILHKIAAELKELGILLD